MSSNQNAELPASLVLDGAAGTYLETKGVALHPKLWSSGELLTAKGHENIRDLHRAYIEAGADVVTTVTYQASGPGFVAAGLSEPEGLALICKGVQIAKEEAAQYRPHRNVQVAAGLGPYGAYLSNGEEYTGDYGVSTTYEVLREFWVPRVTSALKGEPDLLLFETVPSFLELQVIVNELAPLAKAAHTAVWVSLSLRTTPGLAVAADSQKHGITLADGSRFDKIRELIDPKQGLIQLIGANCFDVSAASHVISELSTLGLPMLLYPNSGEIYDGERKTWSLPTHELKRDYWSPAEWSARGVRVIGGCCRTTPKTITEIKNALASN